MLKAAGGVLNEPASHLLIALIWPSVIVTVAFVFRSRVGSLFTSLDARIRGGAGFKLGFFELTPTTDKIPTPGPDETITLSSIALLHTSFFSEEGTRGLDDGKKYFQFEVVLIAPDVVLDRVRKVTYLLPNAWPEDRRITVTADRAARFKLKELANGTAIVLADVEFKDDIEPLRLNRFIDLHSSGPRI
ncbi:MAG: pYEATS domain-containing protein [Roseobacter sp.]